jgi:hypothetical protein
MVCVWRTIEDEFGRDQAGRRQRGLQTFRETRRLPGTKRPRERSVPGNEGVGEHVRTRFQSGFWPGEIADRKIRTERRKPVSSAGSFLRERTLSKYDPAV